MQSKKMYKQETMIQGVFVFATHIESGFVYIQIHDYVLQDSLYSSKLDFPMNEAQVIEHLKGMAREITEEILDNLLTCYVLNKYKVYKALGEVSDLKEFLMMLKKEIDVRGVK